MAATGVPVWDAVIESEVRALRHAVKDALRAEDVGGGGIDGRGEVAVPFALGCDAIQVVLFHFDSFGDLSLLLGAGLGEFLLHAQRNFNLGILGPGDRELAAEGEFAVEALPRSVRLLKQADTCRALFQCLCPRGRTIS